MTNTYKKLIIYYFSGTGNARHTARWIADEASKSEIEAHIENIEELQQIETPDPNSDFLIGFCGPTHGFNFPPVLLNFLWKFPKGDGTDVFIVNTRAGMKLGKLFLPGLGGMAQYFAAITLWLKGYRIVGMQPMDLPSNWISIHPGLREKVVRSIFERCEKIARNFACNIISGRKVYKALLSLPFDAILFPIAVLYYIIGRFAIAKTFIATSDCTRCGLCKKQCPVKAIKMIRNRPYWTFRCESCMRCINSCPERAIQTTHTFTIIIWWLIMSFALPWVVSKFYGFEYFGKNALQALPGFITDLLSWFVGLMLIFIAYKATHYLLKFRLFDNLIAYTSFTKYLFWRRYKPNTK